MSELDAAEVLLDKAKPADADLTSGTLKRKNRVSSLLYAVKY